MPLLQRLANVFREEGLAVDLDDELSFHVAERTDELVSAGMTYDEAHSEAMRRFGNYTLQKERTRDMNITDWFEAFVADLKQGVRQLHLNPGFATVAIRARRWCKYGNFPTH